MNMTMVISGHSNDEARELLRGAGHAVQGGRNKDKKGAA